MHHQNCYITFTVRWFLLQSKYYLLAYYIQVNRDYWKMGAWKREEWGSTKKEVTFALLPLVEAGEKEGGEWQERLGSRKALMGSLQHFTCQSRTHRSERIHSEDIKDSIKSDKPSMTSLTFCKS